MGGCRKYLEQCECVNFKHVSIFNVGCIYILVCSKGIPSEEMVTT